MLSDTEVEDLSFCLLIEMVGSVNVPKIVFVPIIVDTKVLGGIVVVKTEEIVRGLSLV